MPTIRPLMLLGNRLSSIQSILSFDRWEGFHHFEQEEGVGRVAVLATALGFHLGANVVLFLLLQLMKLGIIVIPQASVDTTTNYWPTTTIIQSLLQYIFSSETNRLQLALQWTVYSIFLCIFHLAEFFSTCIYNPSVTSSDSFMINQSKAYTAAALISWVEFTIRILFFQQYNSPRLFHLGILFVMLGQTCRTLAMVTCGESFNHYIQRDKKDNHVLVTNGIYSILRHPSYFGFYYWSVGTQMILSNYVSMILYALAAWKFFHYRIPFEERTLRHHFGSAYDEYASRTIIGIPFV